MKVIEHNLLVNLPTLTTTKSKDQT